MLSFWRRLRAFLERASRQSVTRAGLVFTAAMLMVGVAAMFSANNLLFLILAAMLSTLMVSGLISRLSLAGLELDLALPEHIAARRRFGGRIYIRNSKSWLPSYSVHLSGSEESFLTTLYFPAIPGGAVLDESVEVCFERRGIYRERGFLFTTRFPFGFIERRAQVTLRREVTVYPCIDAQMGFDDLLAAVRGDMATQFRGRGHDFHRIRPYEILESARHVDWKATAKVGSLQVREFAREQERLIEIFLDLHVPPSQRHWFETAVDACAYVVWSMASRGGRVRFRTQRIEISIPETADVYAVLRYLATVAPSNGGPIDGPIDEESCRIVFTSGDPARLTEAGWGQARVVGPESLRG